MSAQLDELSQLPGLTVRGACRTEDGAGVVIVFEDSTFIHFEAEQDHWDSRATVQVDRPPFYKPEAERPALADLCAPTELYESGLISKPQLDELLRRERQERIERLHRAAAAHREDADKYEREAAALDTTAPADDQSGGVIKDSCPQEPQ